MVDFFIVFATFEWLKIKLVKIAMLFENILSFVQ